MALKKITKENTPPSAVPYRNVNNPFRFQFVIPGSGIVIEEDKNGICYISADMFGELVAGDNITIDRLEDGRVMISSVSTVSDIAAGQNVTIDIDPDTGTAIINAITGGDNEHYQGIFDTAQDLIDFDTDPETGDYGMIKNVTYSDGGETTWNGQYKYCFYIGGQWTVVDQMLTFTKDLDLLQQFYSVGGSSPVIYLHEVARSGNFNDLNNVPIVATPEVTVEGSTVTATCSTEGAEIWYTADGSMPHVNGTKYTGPITVSGATTFRFVGIKNGMINSLEAVVGADYGLEPPTIELDWHDGMITMDNPNQSGTIYYTTDGSTPTNASTAYTEPFVITENTNFRAIVIDGAESSEVSAKQYLQLYLGKGSYSNNSIKGTTSVNFTSTVAEAEYRCTKDGSTPTWESTESSGVETLPYYGGVVTVKVRGFAPGYIPSDVRSVDLGEDKPVSPPILFDPQTGLVSLVNSANGNTGYITGLYPVVKFTPAGQFNSNVFYTTDGSTPTANSTLYTGPFQIEQNTTVRAIVVAYGEYYSDVATENIVIVDEPVISMNYLNGEITMAAPAGMDIYYTLNGSTPSIASTRYTGPIKDVPQLLSRTVKAVAVRGLDQYSAIVTANYTRVIGELPNHRVSYNNSAGLISVEAPGIPNGSEMYSAVAAPGADIVEAAYSRYTSPVSLEYYASGNPKIVIFKACLSGYLPYYQYSDALGFNEADAPVISVDEDTDLVTISLDGNTADIPLQTNDNTPALGARIYYTTDGSTPTDQSTLYTRPFTLPEGSTAIKAIAVCYGEWESDVTTEEISGGGGTYGVRFLKNSDSADGTRVGDLTLHASLPIQSGMKRCLLLDNGTVNYYLDPEDSTKKADGTAADLTGADGQYMVEIPEFYANLIETDDYVEFSVSTNPVDGYFHYPTMYVSADEACLDRATGKLAAVVNDTANYRGGSNDASRDSDPYLTLLQRPVSGISWQDLLDAARLRGSGWCNYMNMVNSALYFLFITEYATRNTQKAYNPALTAEGYRQGGIGPDASEFYDWGEIGYEPFIPTGFTASLGNNTGVKDLSVQWESEGVTKTHTAHVSSYRGVSVPIGHLGKAASGYLLRATTAEDVYAYFRNNPDTMSYEPVSGDVSVRVPLTMQGQLVSKLGFAVGNLYPAEGTGDTISDPTQPLTTYYCDGAYVLGSDMASELYDPESPVSAVPCLGGFAVYGSYCGFAYAFFENDPSAASPYLGSRLCFISNN